MLYPPPVTTRYTLQNVGALYHYTSVDGFLGIINSNSIWMSNIRYQNDSIEFLYAVDLMKELIESEYPGLYFSIEEERASDRYTFSMSSDRDSLSQWRGYAGNNGYAISFTEDQLITLQDTHHLELYKCVYDLDKQIEILKGVIRETPEVYNSAKDYLKEYNHVLPQSRKHTSRYIDTYMLGKNLKWMVRDFLRVAPMLKHPSFADEKEWRLVTNVYYQDYPVMGPKDFEPQAVHGDVKFRKGANVIVPYVIFELDKDKSLFNEVVIGPTPKSSLSISGCEYLLKTLGKSCPVNASATPYQSW